MRISDWSSDVCSSDLEHVVLAVKRDLVDDLCDLAADDLLQDLGRLGAVLLGHLGQLDLLLLGDEVGGDVGCLDVRWVHRRDVHRQAASQFGVAALDLDQHADAAAVHVGGNRSEERTSELQSLMRHSYAVFCLKQKNPKTLPLS